MVIPIFIIFIWKIEKQLLNCLGKDVISNNFTGIPVMKKEESGTSFFAGNTYFIDKDY